MNEKRDTDRCARATRAAGPSLTPEIGGPTIVWSGFSVRAPSRPPTDIGLATYNGTSGPSGLEAATRPGTREARKG